MSLLCRHDSGRRPWRERRPVGALLWLVAGYSAASASTAASEASAGSVCSTSGSGVSTVSVDMALSLALVGPGVPAGFGSRPASCAVGGLGVTRPAPFSPGPGALAAWRAGEPPPLWA